jgi:tRNA dimethylallyltransferase
MRLRAIVGPTASGKTRMAVEVAQMLERPVEIVSCDSMGVYRGLDIAADKPTAEQRGGVPHHLFDIADASDDLTAVEYRTAARAVIADIDARGALPLLVGGSGLWFRAVVDDLETPMSCTRRCGRPIRSVPMPSIHATAAASSVPWRSSS